MADDAFLRRFATRLGLPTDATTNADLERALETRLGFDQKTELWAARWFSKLTRHDPLEPVRVVQQQPRQPGGPALTSQPRMRGRRR